MLKWSNNDDYYPISCKRDIHIIINTNLYITHCQLYNRVWIVYKQLCFPVFNSLSIWSLILLLKAYAKISEIKGS